MKLKSIYSFFIVIILFYIIRLNWLNAELNYLIMSKDAEIGIAIIKNQKEWVIGSNNSLPMLSVFKYFVALKVLDKSEKEKISLNKEITVNENMINEKLYSPMLDKHKTFPFKISIENLLKYMISKSDNNACDVLINYAGGTKEIEKYIHSIGFVDIEISQTELSMNSEIEKQYLNKARPMDIIKMMKLVRDGNILSKEHRIFLDEIMAKTITGENKLKSGLPQGVILGHKTGSSSRLSNGIKIADNDSGYVFLPNGNVYYIAVMIKDSKMSDEENAKLISKISKITYDCLSRTLCK